MKTRKVSVRRMTLLAMLSGVLLVMQTTGIGMIPLPMFKLTIMHIPVILGSIVLGPGAGAFLGAVFGACSVWANTTAPNVMSMFFSPFLTMSGWVGAVKALWVSVGCRVTMGCLSGWLWRLLRKSGAREMVALPVTAAVGTLLNTVLVLGSICLLFPQDYAQLNNTTVNALFTIIGTTVVTNGLAEALAAAVLVTGIGKALLHYMQRSQRRK